MRLNKYIAHSGFCSRRKADEYIFASKVTVNNQIETNPAIDIINRDIVVVDNHLIKLESKQVYFLLNKPLYTITSVKDEKQRKTVIDLINTTFRIYPIGRLDFMTTGVLLLTNDGELTQKLSHPSSEINKSYSVRVQGDVNTNDIDQLKNGIKLDNKLTYPAKISHIKRFKNMSQFEIEIHEGRNRQVRRMIDALGYNLISLDRIQYAGISYDKLNRGDYRNLSQNEITYLKQLVGMN